MCVVIGHMCVMMCVDACVDLVIAQWMQVLGVELGVLEVLFE